MPRSLWFVAVALALAALALGGFAVGQARLDGGGAGQALAAVTAPPGAGHDGEEPANPVAPQYERWEVAKVTAPVVVRTRPEAGAPVKARLGVRNANGFPTLLLVDEVRDEGGAAWYRVWIAMRPNGSRGWVREGDLAFYTTSAKIEIDLSERKLTVYRRGELQGEYSVAVGKPGLETPTGFFFVNQKLKPAATGGPFGVLAIGISAFQPKLSGWAQGGPVAIHGTNQPGLIGQAISHGCVRMRNEDITEVNRLVPAGSPVVITR